MTAPETAAPAEYERRRDERSHSAAALSVTDRRLQAARLACFALAAGLAVGAFLGGLLSPLWIAPPALVFLALLPVHDRVIRRRERAERAQRFYEHGLARLEHRFRGLGEAGERFRDASHPYAEDLDLFGPGSLFERLCLARTRGGEERLAAWLLAPAEPAEVAARQAAVRELAPRLDLREELALLGDDVRGALHPATLRAWGEAPRVLHGRAARVLARALPLLSIAALGLLFASDAGPVPFALALLLQTGFAASLRGRVGHVASAAETPSADLALLAELLERMEREDPACDRLRALRAALDTEGTPPSRRIARLRLWVELLESRRNQLFAPIAALLLWKTNLALALEDWRARCGPALGPWLDAVAELEALSSLAGFAYEQPGTCWPELDAGETRVEARALGHPLLPHERCVRNDVRLGSAPQVLVVSGSNMSGKSTLLRTLGVNTVLALAGAPACAEHLSLSRLQVGASIRVLDSLQEGTSRFYAEITRLRQIMQLAEGTPPALFLLDEILHGTNSHDRGIGAEAVVRGLLERGAIGLVTTHDLALARVADGLAPRAANVHFEDRVEEGRIEFDYRLRPGVVTHSNALALMRAVGLDL